MGLIVGVAIMHEGEMISLPKPARHHHVIRKIADSGGKTPVCGEQGFITEDGKFLNRFDGLEIAKNNNQILDLSDIRANRLFSENLW